MAIANDCLSLGCRTWRPPNPAGFQSNATYARGLGQHIRPVPFITNIAFAERLPNNFLRLFTFKYTLAVDICDDHCQRARRPVVAERAIGDYKSQSQRAFTIASRKGMPLR